MVHFFEIKKDINLYRARFDQLKEKILDLVAEHNYRYERYDQEYGAMLVYSDTKKLNAQECGEFVRRSDQVFQIYENLLLIVFDMVDAESSYKAAQNFQFAYMNKTLDDELYYALAPVRQENTAIDIGSRLLIIMDYAISESQANMIVDIESMRHK